MACFTGIYVSQGMFSQGSVATYTRWGGGMFNIYLTEFENLLRNIQVNKIL